ncbi:HNH endonuclease [Rossellomorea marisflavi]|uniref:HNH endonuclease n=1 Tax=Rossellomorea marisflavi TaxID=189381 RepID=UPI00296FB16A|nr:HNH endonuclease [Rossellomorea marisflavi]MDW4528093.1 HNH endonuclease [Rossellomorea marisflavi]
MTTEEIRLLIINDRIDKFYNRGAWRRKSKEILKRDNNECQIHKRRGKYSRARNVHHIKEIRDFPELAYDDANLEAVCIQCHNELHPEKLESFRKKEKEFTNEERW